LRRRRFLKYALGATTIAAAGTATWLYHFDGPVFNSCLLTKLPDSLQNHPLMLQAFNGIDFYQLWDSHFHLLGNGLNNGADGKSTDIWLSPKMQSWLSPIQRIQYAFYLDAACLIEPDFADREFVVNLAKMTSQLPSGIRFMLLAFDYMHNDKGEMLQSDSTFYIPNRYAAKIAKSSESYEWIASVHPYRKDALERLEWCKTNGARAVKWLPPAMNIDPSSTKCDAYYQKLIDLNLPLLTHAGDEKAVHSEQLQRLANPLHLRRPLDQGVKVIVAHCASLGANQDLDHKKSGSKTNFELFSRLMNDANYQHNCFADISAINLINRDVFEIKQIIENTSWHDRLLYASDFPLPGVVPVISSKKLAADGLIDGSHVDFLNQVRSYSSWLYDFLSKRLMQSSGMQLSAQVFHTSRHFLGH
jgi:uncharacterized protein